MTKFLFFFNYKGKIYCVLNLSKNEPEWEKCPLMNSFQTLKPIKPTRNGIFEYYKHKVLLTYLSCIVHWHFTALYRPFNAQKTSVKLNVKAIRKIHAYFTISSFKRISLMPRKTLIFLYTQQYQYFLLQEIQTPLWNVHKQHLCNPFSNRKTLSLQKPSL